MRVDKSTRNSCIFATNVIVAMYQSTCNSDLNMSDRIRTLTRTTSKQIARGGAHRKIGNASRNIARLALYKGSIRADFGVFNFQSNLACFIHVCTVWFHPDMGAKKRHRLSRLRQSTERSIIFICSRRSICTMPHACDVMNRMSTSMNRTFTSMLDVRLCSLVFAFG